MRRHQTYIPDGMEKVFSVLNAYRADGTSGFYGDEDCMFVPLLYEWSITMARENNWLTVQLTRHRQPVTRPEKIHCSDYNRIQELLAKIEK